MSATNFSRNPTSPMTNECDTADWYIRQLRKRSLSVDDFRLRLVRIFQPARWRCEEPSGENLIEMSQYKTRCFCCLHCLRGRFKTAKITSVLNRRHSEVFSSCGNSSEHLVLLYQRTRVDRFSIRARKIVQWSCQHVTKSVLSTTNWRFWHSSKAIDFCHCLLVALNADKQELIKITCDANLGNPRKHELAGYGRQMIVRNPERSENLAESCLRRWGDFFIFYIIFKANFTSFKQTAS